MTFDEKICAALAFTELPVAELVYTGGADEYLTYNQIYERGAEHADDGPEAWKAEYHIHYHTRKDPHPMKRAILRALAADEDFAVLDSQVLYDETGELYYHVVIDVEVLLTPEEALAEAAEETQTADDPPAGAGATENAPAGDGAGPANDPAAGGENEADGDL